MCYIYILSNRFQEFQNNKKTPTITMNREKTLKTNKMYKTWVNIVLQYYLLQNTRFNAVQNIWDDEKFEILWGKTLVDFYMRCIIVWL